MSCTNPRLTILNGIKANGKMDLLWPKAYEYSELRRRIPDKLMFVRCGTCNDCLLNRSSHWALRCLLESTMHTDNCFITLTYNNVSLAQRCPDGSLRFKDFQDFMKRLRYYFPKNEISYFACGEYGLHHKRPHFHAIIFGLTLPDRYPFKYKNGYVLWRSDLLERIWPFGFSTIGDANFKSSAYVARYCMKKFYGANKVRYDGLVPEDSLVSLKPGIGRRWILNNYKDVYGDIDQWYDLMTSGRGVPDSWYFGHDVVRIRENDYRPIRPPKYFDNVISDIFPEFMYALKQRRRDFVLNSPSRDDTLAAHERLLDIRVSKLIREYEQEMSLFDDCEVLL